MAYDEGLAQRIRELLEARGDVSEKKMFGGVAFLVRGNMSCGVVADELMVRVGPDAYAEALERPHAREMTFTGRPMRGMVYVGSAGLEEDGDLEDWVGRGVAFAAALPVRGDREPAGADVRRGKASGKAAGRTSTRGKASKPSEPNEPRKEGAKVGKRAPQKPRSKPAARRPSAR